METSLKKYVEHPSEAANLAAFRVLYGLLMLISISRFFYYDWIDKFYVKPQFFFSFYGFSWVQPIGEYTYLIFVFAGIMAFLVMMGWYYRFAIIGLFLSFSYIELMDKTYYLNHYYLIILLSMLMIFIPANCYFSIDAYRKPQRYAFQYVPRFYIDAIKVLITIVFFYAGLAKFNSDWLFEALPLKIWLPGRYDLPILGELLQWGWVAYAFSWMGAIYDLTIAFFLWNTKTRKWAFLFVLAFHILTRILFPIGVFPYVMIVACMLFFSAGVHKKYLFSLDRLGYRAQAFFDNGRVYSIKPFWMRLTQGFLILFFVFNVLFPLRFMLYPGKLFWTEQGYRFSWRVMLMEKAGIATFRIEDSQTGKRFYVDNRDFLNSYQEKQMATQPDFILEYAHYLRDHFSSQGHENVAVYVDSYVTLNGRASRRYIDPEVNLAAQSINLSTKKWITKYE